MGLFATLAYLIEGEFVADVATFKTHMNAVQAQLADIAADQGRLETLLQDLRNQIAASVVSQADLDMLDTQALALGQTAAAVLARQQAMQ